MIIAGVSGKWYDAGRLFSTNNRQSGFFIRTVCNCPGSSGRYIFLRQISGHCKDFIRHPAGKVDEIIRACDVTAIYKKEKYTMMRIPGDHERI